MRLRAGVSSDRGLVRQTNEDSYIVRQGLYAVCDGMGGARAGEVASEMACRGLLELNPATASMKELRDAIRAVNETIDRHSHEEDDLLGMGTTMTAALVGDRSLLLAHVGDSRAYLLREGELRQLTEDHSWVGEMVRRGELTPAQAAVHPHRSVITRVLGTEAEVEPDFLDVSVEEGDRLLICSDGLTGMVSDAEIAALLKRDDDPQMVADLLIQSALAGGGEDNVTVVVVDIVVPPDLSGESETSDDNEAEVSGAELDGQASDEILLGPVDRGILRSTRLGRGRRSVTGVRGRLGGRAAPILRPPARSDAGAGQVGGEAPTGATALQDTLTGRGVLPGEPLTASAMSSASSTPVLARRWSRRKWIILATAVVVLVVIAIVGFAIFNSTVYYIGTADGTVALYHGLPGSVLGIDLSSVIQLGGVSYDSLAPYLQVRVDAHDLVSKEEGQLFLQSLSAQ